MFKFSVQTCGHQKQYDLACQIEYSSKFSLHPYIQYTHFSVCMYSTFIYYIHIVHTVNL